jgi:hypothetical protein
MTWNHPGERKDFMKELMNLSVCDDCNQIIAYDDESSMSEARAKIVRERIQRLGPGLSKADGPTEGSYGPCDCCGSQNGFGYPRYRYVILGA